MAARRASRGSPSKPKVTDPVAGPILAGEPVAPRRRGATTSGGPGVLTVTAVVDGKTRETTGAEALKRLPELLRHRNASVWVDLSGPSSEQVEEVGAALGLHPLVVEDVLEGNQRAKIEITDGIVHIVLFYLDYDAELTASELDIVLGSGYLFTAHDSTWEPRATHHLRAGVEPILREGPDHLLWALADDVVDGYFPFADRLGFAIDEIQDEVVREREARDARGAVRAEARAHRGPPLHQPGPRDLQPAHQPRLGPHRRRRDRLLPRHLRPRHPADRRARQLPGARVRDARRLPDDDQQQPLGDHEAPDRGDRHPRGDRGDRGHLRHERGGDARSRGRRAQVSGASPR